MRSMLLVNLPTSPSHSAQQLHVRRETVKLVPRLDLAARRVLDVRHALADRVAQRRVVARSHRRVGRPAARRQQRAQPGERVVRVAATMRAETVPRGEPGRRVGVRAHGPARAPGARGVVVARVAAAGCASRARPRSGERVGAARAPRRARAQRAPPAAPRRARRLQKPCAARRRSRKASPRGQLAHRGAPRVRSRASPQSRRRAHGADSISPLMGR